MRFLDAAAVRAAAPMPELLDAVEAAYRDVAAGRDRSPLRTRVPLTSGDLLLMSGVREGGAGTTVKLVTVMPGNAARGLPTIHALVVWIDATTGEPLVVLDGATLTAMRTGAASGVGTRLMARRDASVLAVIGAGFQAPWQVRAVRAARPIREVRIYARGATRRQRFAEEMSAELGTEVRVTSAASAKEAVRGADVICCATTSSTPVFDAGWVSPGAHVNGVGSFRKGMVELPPELFARAALVAVDQRDAALEEAGDLVAALEAGLLAADGCREIGSLPPDWVDGRPPGAITVFKSVGLAIQDVAAAELVVGRSA
ncbi:MAG TPA: ornithine cyclodeaminase family protein [Candidatus Limnocylindria bacterium]|nr:ornithine cyclodeaminase family protein [Candidatus Limnocylindria bacterium]